MVIASADNFINISGTYYCKPYAHISLSQYWDIFKDVKLLGSEIFGSEVPFGWVSIPSTIVFCSINQINSYNPFIKNKIKKRVWEFIKNENLVYLRMPDYKVLEIYKLVKQRISYFCEFHGDWGESLLSEKYNRNGLKNILKFCFANYRAKRADNYFLEIGKNSIANIAIGPALISKFNLDDRPFLATTNHIVKMDMINPKDKFELKSGVLHILFVGELQYRKGLEYLLIALKDIKSLKLLKFKLTIVGEGYLKEKLKTLVHDYNLDDDVVFKGVIFDRSILGEEYSNADVFVLPSIAGEGVPRVLQEAQSFGCPIIATDIGSTYWQLQNSSGILIKSSSSAAIFDALIKVSDIEERKVLSINSIINAKKFAYEIQRDGIQNFVLDFIK